jgi:ABC-type multidrug transport system fused ATPase/permease subunit
MELDDLKASWQKDAANYSELNKKSIEQLDVILQKKTGDLISLMKRKYEKIISMMLGSMLIVVFVLPIITDGFTYPGSAVGFTKWMFLYLVLIVFYWIKFKSINNLELSDQLKERMEQLLTVLKRNLRIEVTFALLFFLLLVGLIAAGRIYAGKGLGNLNYWGAVVIVPFTGAMIYLITRRYKEQINELKGYLKEYEEDC